MRNKLHKLVASTLLAGVAAFVLAPSAEARREPPPTTTTTEPAYVPPPQYGQNPHPDSSPETDPYAPVVTPTIVPVDLGAMPVVSNPGAGQAGNGDRLAPAPSDTPVDAPSVLAGEVTSPKVKGAGGGVFARTGANTMPLVRAGLAALTLGAGLIMLGRRRRADAT
jgi:hypothetical protein